MHIPNSLPYIATCFQNAAHPVRVWDVVARMPIGDFETMKDAGIYCGLHPATIHGIVRRKGRNRTNKLGKLITIRPLSLYPAA